MSWQHIQATEPAVTRSVSHNQCARLAGNAVSSSSKAENATMKELRVEGAGGSSDEVAVVWRELPTMAPRSGS